LGTRGLLTTTRRGEPALFIDELSNLSIDRDQRQQSEPTARPVRQSGRTRPVARSDRFEQLAERKTKIGHHKIDNNVEMRAMAQSGSI